MRLRGLYSTLYSIARPAVLHIDNKSGRLFAVASSGRLFTPTTGEFLQPHELRELVGYGGMLCSRPNGHILPGYARRIAGSSRIRTCTHTCYAPQASQAQPGLAPYTRIAHF